MTMAYKNKEKRRAYQDRYRAEHREEERAYAARYRAENREEVRARHARWCAENPEYNARYRAKLLAAVEILKQLGIEL
jgi:hypothetical protein